MPGDVPAPVPAPAPVAKAASFFSTLLDRIFWVALVLGGIYFWNYLQGGGSGPAPAVDASFVKIGKTYPRLLGKAYGEAWSDGADALEGSKSIKDSLDAVSKSWEAARTKIFESELTPAMAKIVPENQTDLSPAERAAMVRAWRGLAKGMVE
jgi:hypothetical protein